MEYNKIFLCGLIQDKISPSINLWKVSNLIFQESRWTAGVVERNSREMCRSLGKQ